MYSMKQNDSLQVSLLDWDDKEYVAIYNSFSVGSEKTNYRLDVSGYNAATSTMPDGFALGNHNGAQFTTMDRDNDELQGDNCASKFSGGMLYLMPTQCMCNI